MKLFRSSMLLKHKYYVYVCALLVFTYLPQVTLASDLNKNEDLSKHTVAGWFKNLENDHNKNPQELALRLSVDQDATKDFFSQQRVEIADHEFGYDLPEHVNLPLTNKFVVYMNLNAMKTNESESLKVLMVATGLGRNIPRFLDQTTKQKSATINFIINDINPKNYRVLQAIQQYVTHTSDSDKVPPYIVKQFKRISFMPGSILELDFEENSLDGIIAENVLHLFTPHQVIAFYQKVNSSLKLNGFLKTTAQTPYDTSYTEKLYMEQECNMLHSLNELMRASYGKPDDPYPNRQQMCMAAYNDQIALLGMYFIRLNPDIFPHQRTLLIKSGTNRTYFKENVLRMLGDKTGLKVIDSEYFTLTRPKDQSKFSIQSFKNHEKNRNFLAGLHQKIQDLSPNHKNYKDLRYQCDAHDQELNEWMKDKYIAHMPDTADVSIVNYKACMQNPEGKGKQMFECVKRQFDAGEKYYQESKRNKK